jgi:hypothetical protein
MSSTQFVVSSPVHGDFAGYADLAVANAVAHRLNSRLFDAVVYFPLVEVEFVVSMEQEAALNRQYRAEEFEVVRVIEVD